jgi:hypothetical protein
MARSLESRAGLVSVACTGSARVADGVFLLVHYTKGSCLFLVLGWKGAEKELLSGTPLGLHFAGWVAPSHLLHALYAALNTHLTAS